MMTMHNLHFHEETKPSMAPMWIAFAATAILVIGSWSLAAW